MKNPKVCLEHIDEPEKQEKCLDCVFREGWDKGIKALKKEIEKMVKENTGKNRYRDGETAFDIIRDIQLI